MKNENIFRLATMALLLMGSLSQAPLAHANQCQDIFVTKVEAAPVRIFPKDLTFEAITLKADRAAETIKDKKDPRFTKTMANLLRMQTETIFLNASEKLTIEKGELRLARLLNDGRSIEFEYVGDKRGDETVFRLNKVVLIKPNGQDITLDKAPVTVDGSHLANPNLVIGVKTAEIATDSNTTEKVTLDIRGVGKEDLDTWIKDSGASEEIAKAAKGKSSSLQQFAEKAWSQLAKEDQDKLMPLKNPTAIEVPVTLQGPVLNEFMKWIDRVPYLKRTEVREAVDKNHLRRLYWRAFTRSNVQFMAEVTKKQAFKWVLIGAVIYGYTNMYMITPETETNSPKDMILSAPFTALESQIIASVLEKADPEWHKTDPTLRNKIQERIGFKLTRDPMADQNNLQLFMTDLINKETKKKGQVRLFIGDPTFTSLDSLESSAGLDSAKSLILAKYNTGFMIAHFAESERILIVPVTQDGKNPLPNVTAVSVTRKNHALIYDKLNALLGQTERSLEKLFSDEDD